MALSFWTVVGRGQEVDVTRELSVDAGVGLEVNAWREKASESIAFIQWTLSLLLSPTNMSKKSGLFHAGSTIFILPLVQQIGIQ